MPENVGDAIGRHAGNHRHRDVTRHCVDDLSRAFETRLVEDLDRPIEWKVQDDRRRLLRRVLVQDFDDVGGVFVGQPHCNSGRIELSFGEVLCFAHGSPVPIRRHGDRGSRAFGSTHERR